MPILETIAAAATAASLVDDIVKGLDTVFGAVGDFVSGGNKPQTAVSNITSGSGIGAIVRQSQAQASFGTSVGPVIQAAEVALTALPPIIQAVQQRRAPAPVTGFGSPFGQQGIAMPAANGVRTMTRKQFILATARAANPGATSKKIIRSARECGIELAALTFGLDALSVCFLISQPPTRRSRGISAADLRRTRATVRKVHNIEADFREWCKPVARRRRSK